MVSSLLIVSEELAAEVAAGLGMELPEAMPKAITDPQPPEVTVSLALLLMALPGERGICMRQIAVLVEEGVHQPSRVGLHSSLVGAGTVVHFFGPRVGMCVGIHRSDRRPSSFIPRQRSSLDLTSGDGAAHLCGHCTAPARPAA